MKPPESTPKGVKPKGKKPMAEVSAQEIRELVLSNNGSKTDRLNQILKICDDAIGTDAAEVPPSKVESIRQPRRRLSGDK